MLGNNHRLACSKRKLDNGFYSIKCALTPNMVWYQEFLNQCKLIANSRDEIKPKQHWFKGQEIITFEFTINSKSEEFIDWINLHQQFNAEFCLNGNSPKEFIETEFIDRLIEKLML